MEAANQQRMRSNTAHRNDGKEAEHHPKEVPRRTGIICFARNVKRGPRKAAKNEKNNKSLPFLDWEGYHSLYAEPGCFIVVSQYPKRSLLAINQKPPDIHVDAYGGCWISVPATISNGLVDLFRTPGQPVHHDQRLHGTKYG